MKKIIKRGKIVIMQNKRMVKIVKRNKFSNRQCLKIIHLSNIYLPKKVIDKVYSII